jgi:hypothetical protein
LLGVILHAFIEQGGRVLDPEDGSDVPLALLFGALFRGDIQVPDDDDL